MKCLHWKSPHGLLNGHNPDELRGSPEYARDDQEV
jgi:hypothetical protein